MKKQLQALHMQIHLIEEGHRQLLRLIWQGTLPSMKQEVRRSALAAQTKSGNR